MFLVLWFSMSASASSDASGCILKISGHSRHHNPTSPEISLNFLVPKTVLERALTLCKRIVFDSDGADELNDFLQSSQNILPPDGKYLFCTSNVDGLHVVATKRYADSEFHLDDPQDSATASVWRRRSPQGSDFRLVGSIEKVLTKHPLSARSNSNRQI